jgi:tellurite resistance protein
MSAYSGISLPDATPAAMLAAVTAVLDSRTDSPASSTPGERHFPSAERFRASAASSSHERFFLASLEAAYLVAAADGVDDRERAALGELVRRVTGLDVDSGVLAEHFATFEAAARASSRAARLEAVTDRLNGFVEREEALGFAALVAMADQHFARKEARALIELGETFGFSVGEVQALLESLVGAIERALSS